jgi:hypothetical protein
MNGDTAMPYYAGFDTGICPGPDQLAWLKAHTNLSWCGYYLAPAPSHDDTSWMGRREALRAQGWGLVPIFLGQQTAGPGSHNAIGPQGSTDGAQAAELARNEGFPPQSCLFLDWEDGSSPSPQAQAYIAAWANAVAESGYQPGLYCSHGLAPEMAALLGRLNPAPALRIWAWRVATVDTHRYEGSITGFRTVDPAGCGYAPAVAWQCEQNCELSLPGAPIGSLQVDLSCSIAPDPGAPQ